ncbi:transposase [Streptomyces mirabilis]|uniref:transposase n=2 Tax=Streptomyces mirabilis TaxID=68239 RepID=UPI003CCF3D8D
MPTAPSKAHRSSTPPRPPRSPIRPSRSRCRRQWRPTDIHSSLAAPPGRGLVAPRRERQCAGPCRRARELVIDALAVAERTRGSLTGAVLRRSIESAQYTSRAFAEICRSAGVRQSMGAVGSSADNAAAESFNAAFKRETLKGRKGWSNEHEARLDAFRWLTRYNTRRRHSRLGQRSPIAYENDLQPAATTLAQAA